MVAVLLWLSQIQLLELRCEHHLQIQKRVQLKHAPRDMYAVCTQQGLSSFAFLKLQRMIQMIVWTEPYANNPVPGNKSVHERVLSRNTKTWKKGEVYHTGEMHQTWSSTTTDTSNNFVILGLLLTEEEGFSIINAVTHPLCETFTICSLPHVWSLLASFEYSPDILFTALPDTHENSWRAIAEKISKKNDWRECALNKMRRNLPKTWLLVAGKLDLILLLLGHSLAWANLGLGLTPDLKNLVLPLLRRLAGKLACTIQSTQQCHQHDAFKFNAFHV